MKQVSPQNQRRLCVGRSAGNHFAIVAIAVVLVHFGLLQSAQADIRYKAYAKQLFQKLPANTQFRPDLETYLEDLANSERQRRGRPVLQPSNLLKAAARAQAAEMLLGNFVGHHTKAGYDFGDRIRAYLPDLRGMRGENAARDRRGGKSDKLKGQRIFQQWLGSRRHLHNLMRTDYSFVSTGAIKVGAHLYAVQIFWERDAVVRSNNTLIID